MPDADQAAADIALLTAWREGDSRAGDRLVQRHYRGVLRFFELRTRIDAEDLTQKTFAACFGAAHEWGPDDSFRGYLYATARSQLFMHLRSAARRERLTRFNNANEVRKTGMSTLVARVQEQHVLLRALVTLPEEAQTLLSLHYWEGLNSSELSTVLGVNPSTLRGRLARARELLSEAVMAVDVPGKVRGSVAADLEHWARSLAAPDPAP